MLHYGTAGCRGRINLVTVFPLANHWLVCFNIFTFFFFFCDFIFLFIFCFFAVNMRKIVQLWSSGKLFIFFFFFFFFVMILIIVFSVVGDQLEPRHVWPGIQSWWEKLSKRYQREAQKYASVMRDITSQQRQVSQKKKNYIQDLKF